MYIQVSELERDNVRLRRERGRLTSQLTHHKTPGRERGREREREAESEKEDQILRQNGTSVYDVSLHAPHSGSEFPAVSGFQPVLLPESIPMTSRDVISSLNEHLLSVLRMEKGRTQECEKMRSELQRVQQKFSVVIHQQVCKNLKPQFLNTQNIQAYASSTFHFWS